MSLIDKLLYNYKVNSIAYLGVLYSFFFILAIIIYALSSHHDNIVFEGGCNERNSKYLTHYYHDQRQISYCRNGDQDKLSISSQFFTPSDNIIKFIYSGYPAKENISIYLESRSGDRRDLILPNSHEQWTEISLDVPKSLQGKQIRLVADDQSDDFGAWVGITMPSNYWAIASGLSQFFIILTILNLIFTTLMGILICENTTSLATLYFTIAVGVFGYLSFIAYFIEPLFGQIFSICSLLSLLYLGTKRATTQSANFITAHKLLFPCTAYTGLIIIVGYFPYYDNHWEIYSTAAYRWNNLPIDNWLQKTLADQVWNGNIQFPMIGDWLSSDRPPLQTGINLLFYPLAPKSGLLYQTLSSYCQSFIFLPVLLLLKRFAFKQSAAWVLMAFGFSSLLIFNTLFVWPKLISATYLLNIYLVLLTQWGQSLTQKTSISIVGSSVAFALLCHGGAFFSLLSVAFISLIRWFRQATRVGIPASLLAGVIYTPWIVYQKFFDPPGNRLVKWHLADMREVNDLTTFQAIYSVYENLIWDEWVQGRIINLHIILFEGWNKLLDINSIINGHFSAQSFLNDFQSYSFFYFFTSFWFYSPYLALLIWFIAIAKKRPIPSDTIWLILTTILSLFIWILLMYKPASTLIHQGSYFVWIGVFLVSAQFFEIAEKRILIFLSILNSFIGIRYLLFDNYQWPIPHELYPYFLITILMTSVFIFACFTTVHSNNKQV